MPIANTSRLAKAAACLATVRSRVAKARHFTPRRAVLYTPGCDERKCDKALRLATVDCVVLDCEDGVAMTRKSEARESIRERLDRPSVEWQPSVDVCVRVNSPHCEATCRQDLTATLTAHHLPHTIMIPKVDSPDQVDWVFDNVRRTLASRTLPGTCESSASLDVILFCESAVSLLTLAEISARACELSGSREQSSSISSSADLPSLLFDGLVLGSDDYCADIGAIRSSTCEEICLARQTVVAVARAVRVQPIDAVYIDYRDTDGLRRQAEQAAAWGFSGMQVIHPCQVQPVQQAFSPSSSRVEWARRLLAEFENHQREGRGAFVLDGQMIDQPLVMQARNVITLHEQSPR